LVSAAGASEDVICAALLHDAIEDQEDVTAATIASLFGPDVAAMVCEVSDDKWLPKAEQKAAQIAAASGLSRGAKLIKLADKISNVGSIASSPPVDWSKQRRLDYVDFCRKVVAQLRGTDAVLEEMFDKAAEATGAAIAA
jgi:GTP diphosphokinase / guanosine-3',5'-bis(diphosphate) 3'-diphosphatase